MHRLVDRLVLVGVVAIGVLAHPAPSVWLTSFVVAFVVLASVVLGLAYVVTRWAEGRSPRIQGPRRKPPAIREEALITTQAMWVMAGLVAWPITAARLGVPTGFTWSLEGTGWSLPEAIAVNVAGVFAVDAWTYWKHRALHTKALFGFHRGHHTFRDPTAFASFAVGPLEALWTFLPVLIVLHPAALHWGPAYATLVAGFVILNMYLHCGVEVRWLEASVPRLLLNTSAFHNVHHSHVSANFGEVAYLWDRICRTRRDDLRDAPAGATVKPA
jgi:sterol desaturase/sphingolipid hydroxylase (fatty acid hydroxylase superfamily)